MYGIHRFWTIYTKLTFQLVLKAMNRCGDAAAAVDESITGEGIHRQEAVAVGGFKEFNIFDMRENRMEYEANIFASQASLPDDTILEYIENGYDIQQIARAMCSDINLIALKVDTLIAQGYQLRKQEHQNDFLKYSKKI